MEVYVKMTVTQFYALEQKHGVAFSRAVDMGRCVQKDVPKEECETDIAMVLFPRPGDGWVGYTSPWQGVFLLSPSDIRNIGDKMDPEFAQKLAEAEAFAIA